MERLQIKAKIRDQRGKGAARKARAAGEIPGVMYGVGLEPMTLTVNHHDFDSALKDIESTNMVIDLEIEGKETIPVMLRDFQVDILKRNFTHVDFLKVDLTKKIKVEVPVHMVGTAPGVKEGGILEHPRRHIEVKCLPIAIPDSIDVDVSGLNIGDSIHIEDIQLPEGVEYTEGTNITLAAVVEPMEIVEPEVGAEEEMAEPEVLTEKKAEEKEGEGAEKKEEKEK